MFAKTIALVALGFATVNAILITSPSNSSGWVTTGSEVITWTSVNTDPSNFTLLLVTPANPNSPITLATVQTSSNSYTYTPSSDLTAGTQYRINAESTTGQAGLLAQSGYFEVTSGASSVSASSSASSMSSASSTVASTGSSTGSTFGSTTASSTNSATSAAATSTKSAAGSQYSISVGAGVMILLAGGMGLLA